MSNVNLSCFLISYLVAFGLEVTRLLRRGAIHRGVMLGFGWAGLVAHTIYLFVRSDKLGLPPLKSSAQDWMLVLAWLGVFVYMVLATRDRDLAIGLFMLPLVIALIVAAVFGSSEPNSMVVAGVGSHRLVMLHVSALVIGAAGVLFSLVSSLMYLFQHRRLRHKTTIQTGLRLPNLERLGTLNRYSVMYSVPVLTIGLIAGFVLAIRAEESVEGSGFSISDPTVIVSGLVWLVMVGLLLWLLRSKRPAGRRVAWLTIWSCGFLLATLAVSLTAREQFSTFHSSRTVPTGMLPPIDGGTR